MRLVWIALAAAVSGCGLLPDSRICSTPPPLDLTELAGPSAKPVVTIADECIHRWAYRLRKSDDEARTVAEAVVALCEEPITAQGNALASVYSDGSGAHDWVRARSLRLALGHVVQARAGNCKVPG
jgi:hypothetical protein